MEHDTRNLVDAYKGLEVDAIVSDLDTSRSDLEIAVENLERDFNMGTIIRNANAFNVSKVHVVGRKQWNKRGAMVTDVYMHIVYHESVEAFQKAMKASKREIIAIDIIEGAQPLGKTQLPENAVLVFGAEGPGLSQEMLAIADDVIMIEQLGSTRSVNVGVASGIAIYTWVQQHSLTH